MASSAKIFEPETWKYLTLVQHDTLTRNLWVEESPIGWKINKPLFHMKRRILFVKHAWKTHFTNYLPWNCTSTPMGLLNIVYIGEVQFYRGKVYISTMKSLNICLFLLKHFYYLLCPIPLSLCPIQSVSIPNYVIKCYKTKEFNLVL